MESRKELLEQQIEVEVKSDLLNYLDEEEARLDELDAILSASPDPIYQIRFTPKFPVRHRHRRILPAIIVAAILILLTVLGAVAYDQLYGFNLSPGSSFAILTTKNGDAPEMDAVDWTGVNRPRYWPQGFYAVSREDEDHVAVIRLTDGTDTLTFRQYSYAISTLLDAEDMEGYEKFEMGEIPAVFTQKGGRNVLYFGSSPSYSLCGTVSREELVKIAESIR